MPLPYEIVKGLRITNSLAPDFSIEIENSGRAKALWAVVCIMPRDLPPPRYLKPEIHLLDNSNKILHTNPGTQPNPNLLPRLKEICQFIDKNIIMDDGDYCHGHPSTPSIEVNPYVLIHGDGEPEWGLAMFLGIAYIMWRGCKDYQTARLEAGSTYSVDLTSGQEEQLGIWGDLGGFDIYKSAYSNFLSKR